MKRDDPEQPSGPPGTSRISDEEALLEEIRQLRAAIRIYRELVDRLLSERQAEE